MLVVDLRALLGERVDPHYGYGFSGCAKLSHGVRAEVFCCILRTNLQPLTNNFLCYCPLKECFRDVFAIHFLGRKKYLEHSGLEIWIAYNLAAL